MAELVGPVFPPAARSGGAASAPCCGNCGSGYSFRGIWKKGLCYDCYQHLRRHGVSRPPALWREPPTACTNCGRAGLKLVGGLCHTCYEYQRRHHHPRPPALWVRPVDEEINHRERREHDEKSENGGAPLPDPEQVEQARPTSCRNCGATPVVGKGLCAACYTYRYRHGRDRPCGLWQRPPARTHCRNCGVEMHGRRRGNGELCRACYQYVRRFGRERPRRLWRQCCDCGAEATQTIRVGGDVIPVCPACYALWVEMTADD